MYDAPYGVPVDVLFIGEAPGHNEDATGTPFIGRSGQLLRKMINSNGYADDGVGPTYEIRWAITNVVCCIPTRSSDDGFEQGVIRQPSTDEIKSCSDRLLEFVTLCKPQLVVLLGIQAKKGWTQADVTRKLGVPIKTLELKHPAWILRQGGESSLDYKRCSVKLNDAFNKLDTRGR